MTVLVLSEDCDPTVDRVVELLAARGVPVFRCDTGWFPGRLDLDAELGAGGWAGSMRTEHRVVRLEEVRSVWFRRPTSFSFPVRMSGSERQHAMWEAKLGLGGVLTSLPARWVNPPAAEADCGYKPAQLDHARRCGLTVPDTLVTNRSAAVRRFIDGLGGQVVVKPLGFSVVFEAGHGRPVYTHVLTADDLADLRGVEATAHLFQRYIADKQFEVRLTVVGERMFAAAIHAHSDHGRVDWRAEPSSPTYTVLDVPDHVAAGVRAFMAGFGLVFGAHDFAVDDTGTWWWFECNASGQFGFIEAATGLPISEALADLLETDQP